MKRRRILQLGVAGGTALAVTELSPLSIIAGPARADAAAHPVRIVSREIARETPLIQGVTHETRVLVVPEGGGRGRRAQSALMDRLVYSDVLSAGQLFDRVGVHWHAGWGREDTAEIELRTSPDGMAWGAWRAVRHDEHMSDPDTNHRYALPSRAVAGARFAQYRVRHADPESIARIALTFIDTSEANAGILARVAGGALDALRAGARASAALAAPVGASKIYQRQDWGADETLMKWVPQYVRVQKAIIHHTVSDDGGTDVAKTIRAIYFYHAVTRGWGDIGYNYLVDKFGNIWIGRQGGDNVIAGHAYGWNEGSIGIACIGDYSTTAPTAAMQGAIGNLLGVKLSQFAIAPFGTDAFVHQEQTADGSWVKVTTNPPNVQGHRDANYIQSQYGGQTACPGNGVYPLLPSLRSSAQNAVTNGYTQLPYIDPALPAAGVPGALLSVTTMVLNRGKSPIPAGTVVSYRLLQNGTVALPQGTQVAIASAIQPGSAANVTLPVPVPTLGSYLARFDLQTGGQWWSSLYGTPVRDVWFRSADWSVAWITDDITRSWIAGEQRAVNVTMQNDGGRTWNSSGANPVRLIWTWKGPTGASVPVRVSLPQDVPAGGQVGLLFTVNAPAVAGSYTLAIDLLKENEFAFADKGVATDDTPITVGLDYRASYQPQNVQFTAGRSALVPVVVTNLGRSTYPASGANPVDLGYHWIDATGKTVVWDGLRTKLASDLGPGQSVSLQAQVAAPTAGGRYTLRFDLSHEGITWFSAKGNPTADLSVQVQAILFGATYQPAAGALAVSGGRVAVPITLTNTGNFAWQAAGPTPVDLGYHWTGPDGNVAIWEGARTKLQADVAPGQTVTLQALVLFPTAQGAFKLSWDLVQEGVTWFSCQGVHPFDQFVVVGPPPSYDAGYDTSATPAKMPTEIRTTVPVVIWNKSNFAWGAGMNLSYHWYDAAGNVVVWDGWRTPIVLAPGDSTTVFAQVAGPLSAGQYQLRFDLVQEGVTWFSGAGVAMGNFRPVIVAPPAFGALYSGPASGQVTLPANGGTMIPVTVKNTGTNTWRAKDGYAMAYHFTRWDDVSVVWEGVRTALPSDVAPGQVVTINGAVRAPAAGSYVLKFDLLQEGVTWFSDQGVPTGNFAAQVT